MIQRFDPSLLKTHNLIVENKKKEVKKDKFTPKINKGIDKQKMNLIKGDQKLKVNKEKKEYIQKVKHINSEGWKSVLS